MSHLSRRRARMVRTSALGVVAWSLAAIVVGFVAWWAVTMIGAQSRASDEAVLGEDQVAAALAAERARVSRATADQSAEATSPTPSPSPSATPKDVAGDEPDGEDVVRTWQLTGGSLGVGCRGDRIRLLFATPTDGWTLEVKDGGPRRVEVELVRGDSETKARAECRSGRPVLTAEEDQD